MMPCEHRDLRRRIGVESQRDNDDVEARRAERADILTLRYRVEAEAVYGLSRDAVCVDRTGKPSERETYLSCA